MIEQYPAILPLLYEYRYDFTKYADVLSSQVVDKQPTQEFADALAAITGDPWTLEPKKEYTLYKSSVTYIGDNQKGFPTSKRFKRVLCLALSTRYRNKLMYLVYNDPA